MTVKPAPKPGADVRSPATRGQARNPDQARAALTWDPAGEWWEAGGVGAMWDAIVYDPDLNLIYVGAGNGTPWNRNIPSPYGGHSRHPMSCSPVTGLVYIPAQGIPVRLAPEEKLAFNENAPFKAHGNLGWNPGFAVPAIAPEATPFGALVARDPVKQEQAWRQKHISPWNGGAPATAGNLVFQGAADGRFVACDATTGAALWQTPVGLGVVTAPSGDQILADFHAACFRHSATGLRS